ncbi:gamma-glutamylcyclotransferase [Paraburkholderia sp.]|uniref:gamma-glutamylcyclotransferase n=1 Tax=Paraburkholderia sp. TaxID=1926495 RepID=UPI00260138D9|nr:gamma-glutamylcyclotransferase [Paraburkholderia sp.]
MILNINDLKVIVTSGQTHHPVVTYTGNPGGQVTGMVFAITPKEFEHADDCKVDAYRRDSLGFASGVSTWVYVDVESPRQG